MTDIDPKALALRVADLEEATRLAEVGEYLFNARRYSYGDGYTEPREMGIDWQWQQSAPNQYGEGMLLAAATKWHDEQAEDGIVTEARKLRDLRDALAAFLREAVSPWRPAGEKQVQAHEALQDSAFRAGALAGWNAQFASDPNAAINRITHYEKGALAIIHEKRAWETECVPTPPAGE